MSGRSPLSKKRRWTSWKGVAGFSYKYGEYRADMEPVPNPENVMEKWRAVVWRGNDRGDVVAVVTGLTHWHCADEVEGAVEAAS